MWESLYTATYARTETKSTLQSPLTRSCVLPSEKETGDGKCEKLYKFVGQTDRTPEITEVFSPRLSLFQSSLAFPFLLRATASFSPSSSLSSFPCSFLVSVSRLGVARVSERRANTSIFNETPLRQGEGGRGNKENPLTTPMPTTVRPEERVYYTHRY